jgi:hypothetical protein
VVVWRGDVVADPPCSPVLADHAERLAAALAAPWLAVTFDGAGADAAVAVVDAWPDVDHPALADGLTLAVRGVAA